MTRILGAAVLAAGILIAGLTAFGGGEVTPSEAAPQGKVFVCKYVGTPGLDEVLQTGNNPISVSVNAIPIYDAEDPDLDTAEDLVGESFADAQGRSFVLGVDYTPGPEGDPDVSYCPGYTPPTPTPVEVTPSPTPSCTPTPSPTPTPTEVIIPTPTPTSTPSPEATPTGTPISTPTPGTPIVTQPALTPTPASPEPTPVPATPIVTEPVSAVSLPVTGGQPNDDGASPLATVLLIGLAVAALGAIVYITVRALGD